MFDEDTLKLKKAKLAKKEVQFRKELMIEFETIVEEVGDLLVWYLKVENAKLCHEQKPDSSPFTIDLFSQIDGQDSHFNKYS
jgi:hypothetical protein